MEDQTHGYIHEIASPRELGVAGCRDQALIVWHHGDGAATAHLAPVIAAEALSEALWNAGLLLPRTEEATP